MTVQVAEQVLEREELTASPIPPAWVLAGDPQARVQQLAANRGATQVALWDCSAGTFRWQFGPCDETVHILEGNVRVTGADGTERLLTPGDVALFHAGSTSIWTVDSYVKKLAVLHDRRTRARRAVAVLIGKVRPSRGAL